MADKKLSELIELAATPANDDEIYIRDVSEAAAAESKRITAANLIAATEKLANKDAISGYAGLDASQKVIKNPANATATPTANKIPIADGSAKLDGWVTANPVKATGAELDTGTDDAKFATALAIKNSHNVPSVAPSTSGNVLTSDGTDWTSAAGGGESENVATLAANITTQSTAFVDATGLSFSVEANKTYIIEYLFKISSNNASGRIDIAVNAPADPVLIFTQGFHSAAGTTLAYVCSTDYDTTLLSVSGSGVVRYGKLSILFANGANAGTFALRFAVNNAAYIATIYAGSTLRYRKVD